MSGFTFRAMGCEVHVVGAPPSCLQEIADLFARRERTFTRFLPGSELDRMNASLSSTVVVSPELARALRHALDAATATRGLVDPTLEHALMAAGYDRDFAEIVDDEREAGAGPPGRVSEVSLVGRLLSRPPGLALDLNGVVKSLTVDDACALLPGPGLVSAGGDLAVRGPHTVALPGGDAVTVRAGGLATSGRSRRVWRRAGTVQHHLIDPRTGRPSTSRWVDVTVSAATCLEADVAAKAAFLLDEDGPAWLDARGLPGRFTTGDAVLVNESWRRALAGSPVRGAVAA